MKEKIKYRLTAGFARVSAWVIFMVCAVFMVLGKRSRKKIEGKGNE